MGLVVVAHGPRCSETHRIFQDQELNSCPLYWPWRREWQSTPVFLLGESHVLGSLAACRPWGCEELELTEWLSTLALVGRLLTTGSSRKPPKVRVLTLKSQRIVVSGGESKDRRGDREAKKNHHMSGHQTRYGPRQNFTYITASQLFYSPENFNKRQKKLQQPTGHF